ncbi:MAG: hypothetical protein JW797_00025 [Bradymonadales bacterium]|nr:hypothetical protein [Bradymonadales bacterium]
MSRLNPTRLLVVFLFAAGTGLVACRSDEPSQPPPDLQDIAPVDMIDESEPEEPAEDVASDVQADPEPDTGPDAESDPQTDIEEEPLPICVPEPTPESFQVAGPDGQGSALTPGGRDLTPAGANLEIDGFPSDLVLSPDGRFALVTSTSSDDRRLVVVDLESATVVQNINRREASYGLAITAAGNRVYASGGANVRIDIYDMATDGTLTEAGTVDLIGFPSGLALSPDGTTLWVGMYFPAVVAEIDTATLTVTRQFPLEEPVWDLLHIPSRQELYLSSLAGYRVTVLDLVSGEVQTGIEVGQSPAGMACSPDGDRVWVAVSGTDRIATIDTQSRTIVSQVVIAERDLVDDQGETLPNSNINAVTYDAGSGRLYATRGADNAVSVLNAESMTLIGSFPTAWYPTGVAIHPDGTMLIVIEGKGFGAGPSLGRSSKSAMTGSVTLVDLAELDLSATSQAVVTQYNRPTLVFPFECEGTFPIPTRAGQRSPIEYVFLIVKENKTFDCVFGDLTDIDVDADPDLVRYGEEITPNQHALARTFAFSDNFYTEVENSDMGHLLLTATHLTEFAERIWLEAQRLSRFEGFQVEDAATPVAGNFFTHLMDHGIPIRIFGEIVGMFAVANNGLMPIEYTDWGYPGGPLFNLSVTDESRARYLSNLIDNGELTTFSFILLPNDHTMGTRAGELTPESMVSDNDYAVGLFIEALSHSAYWPTSAVFLVEDDPQGCYDHLDTHRSFITVISPWARRGYVSHVNSSFVSIFATIERILGVPPMGRPDASASPLWDMFTGQPDNTPYTALERQVPDEYNSADAVGAEASAAMDFRSPDRNPDILFVLDSYRLYRMGRIDREEADRRIAQRFTNQRMAELAEEAEEEAIAFESAWQQYQLWLQERNLPIPELRHGPEPPR